jgi:hypothetical protein
MICHIPSDIVGQPKQAATVRLTPTDRTRIAARAARADVDFSHMVRRMLAYADQHMPDGWVPMLAMEQAARRVGHGTGATVAETSRDER